MIKRNYITVLIFALIACCYSCEEEIDAPKGDVILNKTTIEVGEEVEFKYAGDADLIVLYSGEKGHEYVNKDRVETEAGTPRLKFEAFNRGGTMETGIVSLLYSVDYDGAGDPGTATWTVVTTSDPAAADYSEAHWGTVDNKSIGTRNRSEEISLEGISGANTYFAFKYECSEIGARQKYWYMYDLNIVAEVEGVDNSVSHYDFLSNEGISVISADGNDLTWKKQTSSKYKGSFGMGESKGTSENEDWMIFSPLDFSTNIVPVNPDKGITIKNINETNKTFSYKYSQPGTYTATFVVSTWDYVDNRLKQDVVEKTITVTEVNSEG
ncbi:DUF5017 domain-containing protein [Puteibacter caeruleilacunae]|nr:DUF5017 domain-containing protein [Puteibacter caeruleilacunae]